MFGKQKLLLFFLPLLLWIVMPACSKYQKVLKSKDLNLKYEKALEYYNDEQYYKALPLLEELYTYYRGSEKAETIYYHLAYTDYYLQDYVMAGFRFKNFVKTYPTSKYAEECHFMSAYCYYINSPKPSLDQTNTLQAMKELQLFINQYPNSTRIDSANTLMDNMINKLETKAFDNAWLYYHMRNYKAAIVAFNNMLEGYPDTEYREKVYFYIFKAYYLLAENSIESKKEERLDDTLKAYVKFVDNYPNSIYLKEAESLYEKAQKEKEKFENQKS